MTTAPTVDWCQQELASCPLICEQEPPGGTLENSCDADSLTYACVCGSGNKPNVSEYTLTLPYFTCIEWGNQCVAACGSDNQCAGSCRQDHPCGALNPKRVNTTTTAGDAAKTSTAANQVFTGFASGNLDNGVAPPLGRGWGFGMLVVLGGLGAGFLVML